MKTSIWICPVTEELYDMSTGFATDHASKWRFNGLQMEHHLGYPAGHDVCRNLTLEEARQLIKSRLEDVG